MLEGREFSIGVSGKLWKFFLVMYDRQTDTLWSHLTAEGLLGPLKGKRLNSLPSAMMTWTELKRLFPGTRVLKKKMSASTVPRAGTLTRVIIAARGRV
jgi:hypothetical protein